MFISMFYFVLISGRGGWGQGIILGLGRHQSSDKEIDSQKNAEN